MTVVIAHAGHWLPQLLYLAPLIVLVVAIVVGRVRERREGRRAGRDDV
jgi:cytochrome c oxidase assembly factor CtaG